MNTLDSRPGASSIPLGRLRRSRVPEGVPDATDCTRLLPRSIAARRMPVPPTEHSAPAAGAATGDAAAHAHAAAAAPAAGAAAPARHAGAEAGAAGRRGAQHRRARAAARNPARPLEGDRRSSLGECEGHAVGNGQLPSQRARLVRRPGISLRDRQRRGLPGRQGLRRAALEAPGYRRALQGRRGQVLRDLPPEQLLQLERHRNLPDRELRQRRPHVAAARDAATARPVPVRKDPHQSGVCLWARRGHEQDRLPRARAALAARERTAVRRPGLGGLDGLGPRALAGARGLSRRNPVPVRRRERRPSRCGRLRGTVSRRPRAGR